MGERETGTQHTQHTQMVKEEGRKKPGTQRQNPKKTQNRPRHRRNQRDRGESEGLRDRDTGKGTQRGGQTLQDRTPKRCGKTDRRDPDAGRRR